MGYNQEKMLDAEHLPRIKKKKPGFVTKQGRDGPIRTTSGWNYIEVQVRQPDCKDVKRTELNEVKEILEF